MKPIDIFDAMEGIPDQIIDAAKPSRLKHGESRKAAVKQVPEAKTAGSEQRRRNDNFLHLRFLCFALRLQ